jgi:hypothetical protein
VYRQTYSYYFVQRTHKSRMNGGLQAASFVSDVGNDDNDWIIAFVTVSRVRAVICFQRHDSFSRRDIYM